MAVWNKYMRQILKLEEKMERQEAMVVIMVREVAAAVLFT